MSRKYVILGYFFFFQTEEFTPSFYAGENKLVDKKKKKKQSGSQKGSQKQYFEYWISFPLD